MQLNMATAWLPTYNGTLQFHIGGTTDSEVAGVSPDVVKDDLRVPSTDTGVHLTKLPSTTFGTYQPPLE